MKHSSHEIDDSNEKAIDWLYWLRILCSFFATC
jgi:hypothetical protein